MDYFFQVLLHTKEYEANVELQFTTGLLGIPVRVQNPETANAMSQLPGEHDGLFLEDRPNFGLHSLIKMEQRIRNLSTEGSQLTGM